MGETQCSKARGEVNRSGPELSPHEVTFHPAGCELEDIKEYKDMRKKLNNWEATHYVLLATLSWKLAPSSP